MRLTDHEIEPIKVAAREALGANVVVRLFGSRVRDDLRGGDIDLLVEVDRSEDDARRTSLFEDRFWAMTEPRKIDVLIAARGEAPEPFERIACRDGVIL